MGSKKNNSICILKNQLDILLKQSVEQNIQDEIEELFCEAENNWKLEVENAFISGSEKQFSFSFENGSRYTSKQYVKDNFHNKKTSNRAKK